MLLFLDLLSLLAEKDFSEMDDVAVKKEAIRIISDLNRYYLRQKMNSLERMISEAESKNDLKQTEVLMRELSGLSAQLKNINYG